MGNHHHSFMEIEQDAQWQASLRYGWMTPEAWESLQPEYERMREWLVASAGNPKHGRLLLHALHHRLVPVAKALLEAGASARVQPYSASEQTTFMPLSYAVCASSYPYKPELLDLLLAHGADPMEPVSDHLTTSSPVSAAIDDHLALADLLARGWDPDMKAVVPSGSSKLHNETPLHKAALGYFDKRTPVWIRRCSVKLLLQAGADLEARNQFGQTPLLLAALYHQRLLPVLIANGADICATDARSRGLLDAIAQVRDNGNQHLAQSLNRRLAQIELQDLEEATAMPLAMARPQPRL